MTDPTGAGAWYSPQRREEGEWMRRGVDKDQRILYPTPAPTPAPAPASGRVIPHISNKKPTGVRGLVFPPTGVGGLVCTSQSLDGLLGSLMSLVVPGGTLSEYPAYR